MYIGKEFFSNEVVELAKKDEYFNKMCKEEYCPYDYVCKVNRKPENCKHVLNNILNRKCYKNINICDLGEY